MCTMKRTRWCAHLLICAKNPLPLTASDATHRIDGQTRCTRIKDQFGTASWVSSRLRPLVLARSNRRPRLLLDRTRGSRINSTPLLANLSTWDCPHPPAVILLRHWQSPWTSSTGSRHVITARASTIRALLKMSSVPTLRLDRPPLPLLLRHERLLPP